MTMTGISGSFKDSGSRLFIVSMEPAHEKGVLLKEIRLALTLLEESDYDGI